MASIRELKSRKNSIQSTQQITKAMKLVATAKLQKAKQRAEQNKAYFETVYRTINSILASTGNLNHPFLNASESSNKGYLVITSNRGLAAGYNSNIVKMILNNGIPKKNSKIYAVGKRGRDTLFRRGYDIVENYSYAIDEPTYKEAMTIGRELLRDYENGDIGEIYLVYTKFKSAISQEPTMIKLLPIEKSESKRESTIMNFEPEEEEVLNHIIPRYMYSLIYGALMEASASEQGARMTAMDSATNNAKEMIDNLSLELNRARQAAITQELSEIVGGADALK